LPTGIFTASGNWFRVSVSDLEAYAGPLLRRVPIVRVLEGAESVLRAPQTLAIWMLLVVLLMATPTEAAIATFVVLLGWSVVGPGLVLPGMLPVLRVLETVWLQGGAFVAGLSLLGTSGATSAVWVGLAGFVLLRWGLLARLTEPIARRLRARLYALPLEDQALRAVIIRYALRERVSLPQIDDMEARMLEMGRRTPRGTTSESDD
jgi:hypothetical protein